MPHDDEWGEEPADLVWITLILSIILIAVFAVGMWVVLW